MTNLLSVVKQRVLAAIGLSGVVGGGAEERDAAGRGNFAAAGQCVSALVRQCVP